MDKDNKNILKNLAYTLMLGGIALMGDSKEAFLAIGIVVGLMIDNIFEMIKGLKQK